MPSGGQGTGLANLLAPLAGEPKKPRRPHGAITIDRRPFPATLASAQGVLPAANRKDPLKPLPVITNKDLEKGLYTCIQRGLIPSITDVTPAFAPSMDFNPFAEAGHGSGRPGGYHPHLPTPYRDHVATSFPKGHPLGDGYVAPAHLKSPSKSPRADPSSPSPPKQKPKRKSAPASTTGSLDLEDEYEAVAATELIIVRGQMRDTTHVFMHFQTQHRHKWGPLISIIRALESLCEKYAIPLVIVDGPRLADLADVDLEEPSFEELMGCICNVEEVRSLMASPGQRFKLGAKGFTKAAMVVQSVARMFLQRIAYHELRKRHLASKTMASAWNIYQKHCQMRDTIKASIEARRQRWRGTMDKFVAEWAQLSAGPRVVVHLPSISHSQEQTQSMRHFDSLQNLQMAGRLCDLRDPNVTLIYVSPFPVAPSVVQYYMKILGSQGVVGAEDRVTFLHPQHSQSMPKNVPLTKSVLWCSPLLKVLKKLTEDKVAYLVPGVVGPDELILAATLMLPMLGPDPSNAKALATKSEVMKLLAEADVVVPIGASDLTEPNHTFTILATLITKFPRFPRWLLKIDHEVAGRGIAVLDLHRMKELQAVNWDTVDVAELKQRLIAELNEFGSKRFKTVNSMLHGSWSSYLKHFQQSGGIIQAVPGDIVSRPVVNLFIEPTGKVELQSIQEQVLSPQFCESGCCYPVTGFDEAPIWAAALAVAKKAFQRDVTGFCSVSFVVYREDEQMHLWAVDLDLHLRPNAAIHSLAKFVGRAPGATLDQATCQPYVYSGLIYHPGIAKIQHSTFFQLCRTKGISFNVQDRTGTLFHLVDSLLRACLGVLCVGQSLDGALGYFWSAVEFFQHQLDTTNVDDHQTNLPHVSAVCRTLNQKRLYALATKNKHKRRRRSPEKAPPKKDPCEGASVEPSVMAMPPEEGSKCAPGPSPPAEESGNGVPVSTDPARPAVEAL
mmetsp:Transcript_125327/g.217268  ORF Transcript_125327/g.217268 Transcript_125327/m.217268 type:complete len:953 (-) Transcript_125327:255-3113(-)